MAKKKSTAKKKRTPKKPIRNRGTAKGKMNKKKTNQARKRVATSGSVLIITDPKGDVPGFSLGMNTHSYDAGGDSTYASVVAQHFQARNASGADIPITFNLTAPTPNPGAGGPIRVPVSAGKWSILHTDANKLYVVSSNRIYPHLLVVWHLDGANAVQNIETSVFTPKN